MPLDLEMKILVVEDFRTTRKMQISLLNQLGFEKIVEADDGEAAIRILQAEKDVGLIISDWNMPDLSGYQLLKWVRANEIHGDTPFVMATAQAEKKESAKAREAGVSNFIVKPFSIDELRQTLEETFGEVGESDVEKELERKKTADGKVRLKVGHIQITDHLVLGILRHIIAAGNVTPKHYELETVCKSGWNPVQRALEKGEIDAALVLAPIAMDLFHYGVPIRLVLLSHKNGSICVKNKTGVETKSFRGFFKNRIFYIPHVLSVHHMLSHLFFREIGLRPGLVGKDNPDLVFEVTPPVKMPDYMERSPETCGFMVAQPVGAKAIHKGGAEMLFLTGEMWKHHPCCVVAVRKDFIDENEDAVYEFTDMLVQAGMFISNYPETSAHIAADFLDPGKEQGLEVPMLKNVLTEENGIRTDDLFPVIEDLDRMQRYMNEKMGIGTLIDLEKFMDPRFAEAACDKDGRISSVFDDSSEIIQKIIQRRSGLQL